jgi:hypothetical protein
LAHREIFELLEISHGGANAPLSSSGSNLISSNIIASSGSQSQSSTAVPPIASNVPVTTGKAILDTLNKCANIVRGVWVIKRFVLPVFFFFSLILYLM